MVAGTLKVTFAEFAFADILPAARDNAPLVIHTFLISSECSPEAPATALLLQNFCGLELCDGHCFAFLSSFKGCLHNNKSPSALLKW